jgi:hypothetical protein
VHVFLGPDDAPMIVHPDGTLERVEPMPKK